MAVLVAVLLALGLLGGLPRQAEAQAQSSVAPSSVVPLRIRVPLFGRLITLATAQVGSGPRVTAQGRIYSIDGTEALPSWTFINDTNTGFYRPSADAIILSLGATREYLWASTQLRLAADILLGWTSGAGDDSQDLILSREAAAVLQFGVDAAGVTNQIIKGPDRITSDGAGGNLFIAGGRNRGASAGGSVIFQTSPAAGAGVTGTLADRVTIDEDGNVELNRPALTAGSQTPTANGQIQTATFKVTVPYTDAAFQAAAVTADVTIATLPAKTFVTHVMTDLTTTFACTAVCTTATLSATAGKTAGGNQYLLSFDADAATGQFGDVAAELGASLAPATVPTLIGDLASWSATTALTMRLTSGTGNLGDGAATNLSQGSATFYITTTKYP